MTLFRIGMLIAAALLYFGILLGTAFAEMASFYGGRHHGRLTASGERFNMHAMTCAHKTFAFGTRLRVSHGGQSVVCRVNDRGPFVKGRSIDLSTAAARQLGMIGKGVIQVSISRM